MFSWFIKCYANLKTIFVTVLRPRPTLFSTVVYFLDDVRSNFGAEIIGGNNLQRFTRDRFHFSWVVVLMVHSRGRMKRQHNILPRFLTSTNPPAKTFILGSRILTAILVNTSIYIYTFIKGIVNYYLLIKLCGIILKLISFEQVYPRYK